MYAGDYVGFCVDVRCNDWLLTLSKSGRLTGSEDWQRYVQAQGAHGLNDDADEKILQNLSCSPDNPRVKKISKNGKSGMFRCKYRV